MNRPKKNAPETEIAKTSTAKDMSHSGPRSSRRQLLSQGINASLGVMFLPWQGLGKDQRLERRSLLTIATTGGGSSSVSASISPTPITVTIHFIAKPGKAKALTTQLTGALPDARSAPGCRYAYVYVMAENPNQIVLFKGWDNRTAQAKYLQWEQSSGRLAKLLALAEGDPSVEYWDFQYD